MNSVRECECVCLHIKTRTSTLYNVLVCLFEATLQRDGGKQAAERKEHKRLRAILDLTDSIGVGGKFDCSFQVVGGFDISSSLALSIRSTKPGLQKWPYGEWGEEREGDGGAETQLCPTSRAHAASASVPALVPCDRMSALFKWKNSPPAFRYKHTSLKSGWGGNWRSGTRGTQGTEDES